MARIYRILLVSLVAGTCAGAASPALAASAAAPGALKKQDTSTASPAPTQDSSVTAAPQGQTDSRTTPQVKANDSVPTNKGTLKKVVQTQTTSSTSSDSGSTASSGTTGTRTRTTRTRTHRTSTRRASSSSTARVRRSSGTAHSRTRSASGDGSSSTDRSRAADTAAASAAAAHAPARSHKPSSVAKHPKAATTKKVADDAPLATISRAADQVVEVIPGAVILALAGLAALVLLLIVRTLLVERRRATALAQSYGVTVEALATAIEAKDHTTGGHIERVRRLGLLLAGEVAPQDVRDPQMAYGFLLHDIGKLAVPDAILRAPGRLNDDEWSLMRRHPEEGVRMLSHVPFLDRALDVVRHHHERWDGGGYPDGLSGEEIPLWARIFSVADALDAMTAERPYRSARSYDAALEEIRRHAGTQFDPAVVDALEQLDPARVEPLLEPGQQVDVDPLDIAPLEPLVAA